MCVWCFSVYLGKVTIATRAALLSPTCVRGVLVSSRKSSAAQSYPCKSYLCVVFVYLCNAAVITAVLPSPTCVCGVLVFIWARLKQPQDSCYPVLPVWVCVFSVYLGKVTTATRAALPSPTCVRDVSVFTWVMQQPQEQRYPDLPVYVMLQCLPG